MNLINFTIIWGLGNLVLGLILDNCLLKVFGMGILCGGLCISIARDKERLEDGEWRRKVIRYLEFNLLYL